MLAAVIKAMLLSHLVAASSSEDSNGFTFKRAGYLPFLTATDAPLSRDDVLRSRQLKALPHPRLGQAICRYAVQGLRPGAFDNRVVRFAAVFQNGHSIAVDQDGGAYIDGSSYSLSKTSFGFIVERLAREYPDR